MNVDAILNAMNQSRVEYILVGGMNYLLRHKPILTYDVDILIRNTEENRTRCEEALKELGASWGETDDSWEPVSAKRSGWLGKQTVYCMTSDHGSIDVFLQIAGVPDWSDARQRAIEGTTAEGTPFIGLSDEDMLSCQMALPEEKRRQERVIDLQRKLESKQR